jgi:hypothetical protein
LSAKNPGVYSSVDVVWEAWHRLKYCSSRRSGWFGQIVMSLHPNKKSFAIDIILEKKAGEEHIAL